MLLILFLLALPLASFLFIIANRKNQIFTYSGVVFITASFFASLVLFFRIWGDALIYKKFAWFQLAEFIRFDVSFLVDSLSVVMLVVVTLVSSLVHLFSLEYMKNDEQKGKYFAFLGLFTFSMLGIVLSGNLLITFVFWELVGLSSYLLIGFWFSKEAAASASKKAFLVNRVGDIGFLLGLSVIYANFQTFDIVVLKQLMADTTITDSGALLSNGHTIPMSHLVLGGLGICCGAIGKSAQLPLQIWLPDAMEGPTPVSALIHAATMVAAGVFLMARVYFLLPLNALLVMAFIGSITAFIGAFSAFAQDDIKKVLAFSTISQLGYMVIGIGTGSMNMAVFHLITHAFFKACLFLCAGSVIHSLHEVEHKFHAGFDPQSMTHMGGLRKKLPVTFIAYLIAMLSLAGFPLFSGFLSKDGVINGAVAWAAYMAESQGIIVYIVPMLAFVSALMTAVYMGRQLFLVFFGETKLPKPQFDAIQESNYKVTLPLIILSVLSLGAVYSLNPLSTDASWILEVINPDLPLGATTEFLMAIQDTMHHNHLIVSLISAFLAIAGLTLAYYKYGGQSQYHTQYKATQVSGTFLNRWSNQHLYIDKLYQLTFIRLFEWIKIVAGKIEQVIIDPAVNGFGVLMVVTAQASRATDEFIVDGTVSFIAKGSRALGKMTKSVQNGHIQSYLIWLVLALIGLILYILMNGQ